MPGLGAIRIGARLDYYFPTHQDLRGNLFRYDAKFERRFSKSKDPTAEDTILVIEALIDIVGLREQ